MLKLLIYAERVLAFCMNFDINLVALSVCHGNVLAILDIHGERRNFILREEILHTTQRNPLL